MSAIALGNPETMGAIAVVAGVVESVIAALETAINDFTMIVDQIKKLKKFWKSPNLSELVEAAAIVVSRLEAADVFTSSVANTPWDSGVIMDGFRSLVIESKDAPAYSAFTATPYTAGIVGFSETKLGGQGGLSAQSAYVCAYVTVYREVKSQLPDVIGTPVTVEVPLTLDGQAFSALQAGNANVILLNSVPVAALVNRPSPYGGGGRIAWERVVYSGGGALVS